MEPPKVVGFKYLPNRPPIVLGCVLWLMLDRLAAHPTVQAVIWTLFSFLALAQVVNFFCQEELSPGDFRND